MSELLLTISTPTPTGSVAVTRGDELLGEATVNSPATHSDVLLPAVDNLLTDTGSRLEDVDAIGVVLGPGSFTGLRVGMATAKGLALAAGVPMVGVSSLQALANPLPDGDLPICAMLDARKGEVYAGLFRRERGLAVLQGEEQVIDPETLLATLDGRTLFVGDGCRVYQTLIVRQLGDRALFAPWSCHPVRAGHAALLALDRFRAGEAVAAGAIRPNYLRPSDAEMNSPKTGDLSGIEG